MSVEEDDAISLSNVMPADGPKVISLNCWKEFHLPDIWLPSHVLLHRKGVFNQSLTGSKIHHISENQDDISFSVYSETDSDSEPEIFLSDSDDEFLDRFKNSNDILNVAEGNQTDGRNSPNLSENSEKLVDEIYPLEELNVKEYIRLKNKNSFDLVDGTETQMELKKNKQLRKDRKSQKKKGQKVLALNCLLKDDSIAQTEENPEVDEFYQNILRYQNQSFNKIDLKYKDEFPSLQIDINRCEERYLYEETEKFQSNIKSESVTAFLSEINETSKLQSLEEGLETNWKEAMPIVETVMKQEGMVIENIPPGTTEEDVCTLLLGYGEIKQFSLIPDGKYLRAEIEMDLVCDLDWIIECLNGSQPFGVSTSVLLKCYRKC